MGLGRNIGALKEARGVGWAEIARGAGIENPQAIFNLVKNDSKKSELAGKLATYFGVPLERILADDFDASEALAYALRQDVPAQGLGHIKTWEHEQDLPPGEYAFIPRLEVHLSAGGGRDQLEIEFVKQQPQAFRADWIRKMKLRPSKLAVMLITGDSMESRMHEGDAVVIDTSQTEVSDGKVYALWYDGGERVKRLHRRPGGGLIIRSDNEVKYPPLTLSAEECEHVRIIGRVVHVSGEGGL